METERGRRCQSCAFNAIYSNLTRRDLIRRSPTESQHLLLINLLIWQSKTQLDPTNSRVGLGGVAVIWAPTGITITLFRAGACHDAFAFCKLYGYTNIKCLYKKNALCHICISSVEWARSSDK